MSLLRGSHLLLGGAIAVHIAGLWLILDTGAPPPTDLAPPASIVLPEQQSAPDLAAAMGGRLFNGGEMVAASDSPTPPDVGNAAPPPPAIPPSLAGMATGGRRGSVAILRSATGASRMLRVGESLDGWEVVSITRSTVTVRNGGDTRQLSIVSRGGQSPAVVTNANAATSSEPPAALLNGPSQ